MTTTDKSFIALLVFYISMCLTIFALTDPIFFFEGIVFSSIMGFVGLTAYWDLTS